MSVLTAAPKPSNGQAKRRRGQDPGSIIGKPGFLTYGLLIAFVLGSAFPLYWSFLVASRDSSFTSQQLPPMWPGGNFLANAARVFDTAPFWAALGNSLIVGTVVTVSVVFFCTLAGYAFAKLNFRGNNALFAFVVATLSVPTQLGVIPMFMAMAELEMTGELIAVILPNLVTAFGVFWMRQYLVTAVPYELLEAARMDGCSMIRTFWHVVLPAARPAAAILALFTFMTSWNDFLWPLVVLDPSNPTIQLALEKLQSGYSVDYSLVLAGTTLATLPILVIFILLGRQIVSGIMQGAVKG
ncbi:carbohydrate ABC transporter permease [Actinoalloteichus hymeniacidonis]|uniref:Cellobiose ABC transporter membrane protein n=1 Tax=Actinoalloteichus hymeniacidonis TaxID=340345 RepID=A0AAC9MYF0_9PSEU|nr:carbohydrate ABC transporter permease [Actinoalloteichus hymeniacidonis]AOS64333.1 cellobiose ABC transporter membrane protein [Actinoalloteichus hymeniacidonis]MBB5907599.1 cellobiose transport system permease protein [Actinoalloteichus hymeniacidonis]